MQGLAPGGCSYLAGDHAQAHSSMPSLPAPPCRMCRRIVIHFVPLQSADASVACRALLHAVLAMTTGGVVS